MEALVREQIVENLIKQYFGWLISETTSREVNGWTEITTPYLDRHNDSIQIYIRQSGNEWELTDDGQTIAECDLDIPHYKTLVNTTLNGFGVHLSNDTIT